MKTYMNNLNLYALNEDKFVYCVESIESYDNHDYFSVELKLVAGWDYLDDSNSQGWVPADRFIDDVQYDSIVQYFTIESLTEALEEKGYKVVKDYKII